MVLIAYASSEGSGEPAHPRSAVSPEPSLLAHTSSESRGTFRQKARSLAPLSGWACAVKICDDGMLEDTNSLDGARIMSLFKLSLNFTDLKVDSYHSILQDISNGKDRRAGIIHKGIVQTPAGHPAIGLYWERNSRHQLYNVYQRR